jgi:hypothetical protein
MTNTDLDDALNNDGMPISYPQAVPGSSFLTHKPEAAHI